MVTKAWQANRPRLQAILMFLERSVLLPGQLNMGTFFASHRQEQGRLAVGCALGHYAAAGTSRVISLEPIAYTEQLKSMIMASDVLDEFPARDWQHYTLHYQTAATEAFGETAAMLYLQLGKWDLHRLFYPAGSSYEIRPTLESLRLRLRNMLETTK